LTESILTKRVLPERVLAKRILTQRLLAKRLLRLACRRREGIAPVHRPVQREGLVRVMRRGSRGLLGQACALQGVVHILGLLHVHLLPFHVLLMTWRHGLEGLRRGESSWRGMLGGGRLL
jgi:hypothetical protein